MMLFLLRDPANVLRVGCEIEFDLPHPSAIFDVASGIRRLSPRPEGRSDSGPWPASAQSALPSHLYAKTACCTRVVHGRADGRPFRPTRYVEDDGDEPIRRSGKEDWAPHDENRHGPMARSGCACDHESQQPRCRPAT